MKKWWDSNPVGRAPSFKSPEEMWDKCREYFEATDKRKWETTDWVGKDATEVTRKKHIPYTISGMCIFLNISHQTWTEYRKNPKFSEVITHVESIIYTQKFEGATVGDFSTNIIARDLGLTDNRRLEVGEGLKAIEFVIRKDAD